MLECFSRSKDHIYEHFISRFAFLLYSSLASKCLWRYATLLLRLHSQHVPELGMVVCECVVRMVQESPALGRDAIGIVESMSEGQMMSLNSEVSVVDCSDFQASEFHSRLHQVVICLVLYVYCHV